MHESIRPCGDEKRCSCQGGPSAVVGQFAPLKKPSGFLCRVHLTFVLGLPHLATHKIHRHRPRAAVFSVRCGSGALRPIGLPLANQHAPSVHLVFN